MQEEVVTPEVHPGFPPMPERRRAIFCTKCGHGGETKAQPPHAPCEGPKCGYMAFVSFLAYNDEEMRAFAEATIEYRKHGTVVEPTPAPVRLDDWLRRPLPTTPA